MGNTHVKPRPRTRNKKQVHWKAADRPLPPGKPYLVPQSDSTPDIVTIRWAKPVSDGGSPITGYLVEHKRTGSPHWVRATPLLIPFPELTLSGLEPGWRYQFRVSAENVVGMSDPGELSEPLTVTLQRSAITAPRFTEELVDKTVLENDKAEFVVHYLGQPPPKVCWFKDGFEIFSSRRTRIITENDKSVLTIHQTALTDEGEIKCTATNRAGHASTKSKLTVDAPPSIRLPRNYEDGLLFELGETIRLKVSIAGRPAPLVFWSHNGETIQNDERHEIENGDKFSFLKINEATRQDRGEYQIKAVNKIGEDQTSFLVTITDKPSPPGKARVVMTLGRSVTLTWGTPEDDGGCKIGNYVVEYYRLGWNVWLKAATTRQLTTILGDLIEGSEYKFRVKAESPYGMSEPSEESETVFIPDPKRGITTPAIRSRSQPRDIFEDETIFGATRAPTKRTKPEPRSQSSSRVEKSHHPTNVHFSERDDVIPIRPERTKVKSPPKTPEASPHPTRKMFNEQSTVNNRIFDSASIARDLAYGSPNLIPPRSKASKQHLEIERPLSPVLQPTPRPPTPQTIITQQTDQSTAISSPVASRKAVTSPVESQLTHKQRSPSPASPKAFRKVNEKNFDNERRDQLVKKQRSPSPASPKTLRRSNENFGNERREKSPSPALLPVRRDKSPSPISPKEKEHFGGSSEFMLVLYPDEHKGFGSASDIHNMNEDDDGQIPPPMSLSAPELGAIIPQVQVLKLSASSSELLHERAMARFYQTALAEEAEARQNRDRKLSTDIPKIQINSKDEEDIVGLERRHSLRRRLSAGGTIPTSNSILLAQRRRSLKLSSDLTDLLENGVKKENLTAQQKRELMLNRDRSASEEREEQEFERVRERMRLENQNSAERKSIEIADEEKWNIESNEEGDYEESISEEETESSDDERFKDPPPRKPRFQEDEEEEPYHPGILKPSATSKYDAPFEILTKPNPLPDPNFVPKPILKKREYDEPVIRPPSAPILKRKEPTFRGMEEKDAIDLMQRNRSFSLTEGEEHYTPRQRSFSLVPPETGSPPPERKDKTVYGIKSVAEISGITAAGIVIPEPLLNKKKSEEEAKVAADHYGDIVKNYGKRKKSATEIYTDRDSLKKAAEYQENCAAELSETESAAQATPLDDRSISSSKEEVTQNKQVNEEFVIFDPQNQTTRQSEENVAQRKSSLTRFGVKKRENRSASQSPHRFRKSQSRTPSKSPVRKEIKNNSKTRRNSSPSPEHTKGRTRKQRTPSSSLSPIRKARPMLKEIMTQTSVGLDSHPSDTGAVVPKEVVVAARVRTFMDYLTDLAVLAVACWLYLFNNELFALPVLLVLVYRQLKDELKKRLPEWLPKKYKDK